ncbi:MAG: tryptophan--tRNA ligase, partial [Alphaproteobacteria bacterium CG_4_9_14_3_um_filter_47_13]
MLENKTVLTGIKPTGSPHLGNLVGAIKPVIDLSNKSKHSYVFIADLHALNGLKDCNEIQKNTYERGG